MDIKELERKYSSIPQELKFMRRWVCYRLEDRDGKKTKTPVNAISGSYARSNDSSTWTTFNVALNGVVKYRCEGLGFMLGDGIFGVDLDNHPDKDGVCMDNVTFEAFCSEFIKQLDSYTEKSQSGLGVHIICKGSLPEGRRRKGCVEMYDSFRFFAMTGNTINAKPIEERTEHIIPLWKKHLDDSEEMAKRTISYENRSSSLYDFSTPYFAETTNYEQGPALDDDEVIRKAIASKGGAEFWKLYNGDMSDYGDDHSAADMALCSKLAFWCNGDRVQIDRIFRKTPLMREKWDRRHGKDTYGNLTIDRALQTMQSGYVPTIKKRAFADDFSKRAEAEIKAASSDVNYMNIDDEGEPIFRTKQVFSEYTLDDTGNAMRFYDQFGDCFRYNKDDNVFMFWTGKTWVVDNKTIIRKYANKLIDMMRDEYAGIKAEANTLAGDEQAYKAKMAYADAFMKNVSRLSNKAGKDAMLSELQSIGKMAICNREFDRDPYLLNTDSGVVDLRTGEVSQFRKDLYLSRNTNVKVSYEEPSIWLRFLNDVFDRGNKDETREIIEAFRIAVGYSLTGRVSGQAMFILYGNGSNGKSTFNNIMAHIMGNYSYSIDSNLLMAQGNGTPNTSIQFTLAELVGIRYLDTKETDDGAKLAESTVKSMTGGDQINAQHKYGKPFAFSPQFKLWMSTNNLPIIRGTDEGIWRRIFLFPFLKHFTDAEKDPDMPEKLRSEADRILGWCIKGCMDFIKRGERLYKPECMEKAKAEYRQEMDVVSKFIDKECVTDPTAKVTTAGLYKAFKNWCMDSNEYAMKESKFSAEMQKKGYKVVKPTNSALTYIGIRVAGSYAPGGGGYEFF